MPMPSTNFFTTANEGFITTLGSSILSGATTIPLTSVAGLTNGSIFAGIIEPTLTKQQVFTGVVDTSGVQLTSVVWVRGSNADHAAGVTIVDYVTGASHNMMTTGILKQHTQAGAHGAITATSMASTGAVSGTSGTFTGVLNASTVSSLQDTSIALSTYRKEAQTPFVASGGVWTGDAYASTKAASMTAIVCYINGRRISIGAVTARTFTASKDTYVDVLDNADGTGTLVYTEVTNNAASPALASNSLRIGIVVTGASNIAAAGSINQGDPACVLPIASSVAYSVTDSLGNLIYNTNSNPTVIGYKQITSATGTTATGNPGIQIPGLSCPVIIPAGRKVRIILSAEGINATNGDGYGFGIHDGTVGAGTQLNYARQLGVTGSGVSNQQTASIVVKPTAGLHTYNGAYFAITGATNTVQAAATTPAYISVELV